MTRTMLLTEIGDETAHGIGTARWIRLPTKGRCPYTGLTRPFYYLLIRAGKIRSASLRRPGNLTGVRLVWLPSVMVYLDRHASGGEDQP